MRAVKYIRKKIKNKDEFGKEVKLNVEGDEAHKTWFGGLLSIVISCLMFVYVFLLFKKMIMHEEDVLNYKFPDESLEEVGEISYKEAHNMIFFQLQTNFRHGSNRLNAHKPILLNEEFYSKVDVKFEQVDVDMENPDHNKRVEYQTFEAKPCTAEDFDITSGTGGEREGEDEKDEMKKKKEVWEKFQN